MFVICHQNKCSKNIVVLFKKETESSSNRFTERICPISSL